MDNRLWMPISRSFRNKIKGGPLVLFGSPSFLLTTLYGLGSRVLLSTMYLQNKPGCCYTKDTGDNKYKCIGSEPCVQDATTKRGNRGSKLMKSPYPTKDHSALLSKDITAQANGRRHCCDPIKPIEDNKNR